MPVMLYMFALHSDIILRIADAAYDHAAYDEIYQTSIEGSPDQLLSRRRADAYRVPLADAKERKAILCASALWSTKQGGLLNPTSRAATL